MVTENHYYMLSIVYNYPVIYSSKCEDVFYNYTNQLYYRHYCYRGSEVLDYVICRTLLPYYTNLSLWQTDKSWKVLRGTWFEVSGEKWYPLEEQDSVRIEKEHCRMSWRNRVSLTILPSLATSSGDQVG